MAHAFIVATRVTSRIFYIRRKRDRLRRVGANDIMLNTSAAARIGTEQEIVITANEDFKLLLFSLDCVVGA